MTPTRQEHGGESALQLRILDAINRAQSTFIAHSDTHAAFDQLLADLLALTESEYGFIGEVLRTPAGDPYLKIQAITNIAWNDATRVFYAEHVPKGMAFYNLESLFGAVLTTARPVIANDPHADPRRGGLPAGHPPLNAFLGIPILVRDRLVAMAGVSNRAGGYDQTLIDVLQPLLATIGQLVEARNNQLARHHTETALARTSSLLASVLDAASEVSIIATDPEGLITVFNRGAENLLGYRADEVLGQSSLAPFHLPAEVSARGKALSEALGYLVTGFRVFVEIPEREGVERREWTYVRKTGEHVPVSLVVTAIRGAHGETIGYLGIAQNVAERKQTEAALRDSRGQLQRLLDSMTEGAYGVDTDGLCTFVNQAFLEILGFQHADAVLGRHVHTLIHHTHADGRPYPDSECRIYRSYRAQQPVHADDEVFWRTDGVPVPVEYWSSPIVQDGEVVGAIATFIDISERKAAEAALRDHAEHTQAILDNMLDGLITIDQSGIVTSFNQAAERIFGYAAGEVLSRNVKMLMPNPHRDAHDTYLANYRATGVARIIGIGREVEGQRKDGSLFPMELAVSEVSRQGAPLYVGMVRDISERKRMDRMKAEFVSTVSHELRTPLTSISGALGLLAGGGVGRLPEQAHLLVEIAHKNSLRLTHLINDLLDMEKIAAGKMHFDMQPHALMPLVEHALEANQAYCAGRQVRFAVSHRVNGAEVWVDSQRLMQVMSNLLSNAVKFSPEGGTVDIAVHLLDRHVRVEVIDHGSGIPAEFHSRIFQKFSQADSSDSRQKGGTGLGLAITKELVERMGGQIGFTSVEGKGARFHFTLPLWHAGKPGPDMLSHFPAPAADAPSILVVENDPDIAQLLGLMLTRAGYAVDAAANGAQALHALHQTRYAAMTLDLMLPDINGLEIIRQVRQEARTAKLPIVVISARMEEERLAIKGEFSDIDWLAKPIDETSLLAVVGKNFPAARGSRPRVLHVEDDIDLHQVIRAMAGEQHEFTLALTLADARARLARERFDVVLLDLKLPDGSGWDLLPALQAQQPPLRIVILSGSEMTPDEAGRVEAALLKSQVSPHDLLHAIQVGIQQSQSSGDAS